MHITIRTECETDTGWQFAAEAHAGSASGAGSGVHRFTVRLSWADYNLWSPDGTDRPEEVAKAALRFLLQREPAAEVASDFDLARIRRRYPDADHAIPALIARG